MAAHVLIMAGGSGRRMGGDVPKQFLLLEKEPVLMHTLRAFHAYDAGMNIVLVLPQDQVDTWQELCHRYGFTLPHRLAVGGRERFHSVKNGLASLEGRADASDLIGVHDAVRPLVDLALIDRCYQAAERHEAAVPVLPVVDSIRRILPDETSEMVDRRPLRRVQTPQVFRAGMLMDAYRRDYCEAFSDDASVVQAAGHAIYLVEGQESNLKITTPTDLELARFYLNRREWIFPGN